MQIRLKLMENLDRIIAESVQPMENIYSIKIVQVEGLNGAGSRLARAVDAGQQSVGQGRQ